MIVSPFSYGRTGILWWVLLAVIPPEVVIKGCKKLFSQVQDLRGQAKDAGTKRRQDWNK